MIKKILFYLFTITMLLYTFDLLEAIYRLLNEYHANYATMEYILWVTYTYIIKFKNF